MKQKIYDVRMIEQAEKLMSKRAEKMQKIQDKRKKLSDEIKELQQEAKKLDKLVDGLPNYSASILVAKEIGAEAFGANEKGFLVVRKDNKWHKVVRSDKDGIALEEIKKGAE